MKFQSFVAKHNNHYAIQCYLFQNYLLFSYFRSSYNCSIGILIYPEDTERKFNVHKTFRIRPGRLLNALRTLNLRPVSTG